MDASHVYVRALALGCFFSRISSTGTFRRALTASVADSCAEIKECPFSGVTQSGRVWRKVPESGARSVLWTLSCDFVRYNYETLKWLSSLPISLNAEVILASGDSVAIGI